MTFFFQAEDGIRALYVTGVQTCALPICSSKPPGARGSSNASGSSNAAGSSNAPGSSKPPGARGSSNASGSSNSPGDRKSGGEGKDGEPGAGGSLDVDSDVGHHVGAGAAL